MVAKGMNFPAKDKEKQSLSKCIKKDDARKSLKRVTTSEQLRDKYSSTNTMTERLVSPTPNLLVFVDLPLFLRPLLLLKVPQGPPEARWAPGSAGHDLTMLAVKKDKQVKKKLNFMLRIIEQKGSHVSTLEMPLPV